MDSVLCLYFKQGNGHFARPLWDTTDYSTSYKDNYWTIEFDFRFKIIKHNSENCIGVDISQSNNYPGIIYFDRHWAMSNTGVYTMSSIDSLWAEHRGTYPIPFNENAWHHYAVSVTKQAVHGYVDHFKLLDIHFPIYYLPNLLIQGRAEVAIKNFRLAYTDPAHPQKKASVEKLLTEKKFVTHAITFDKNKAMIKPESLEFVTQLADFLKANARIKLEIDGHTDNDGTDNANMVLSKNRAEAIKNKLVSLGIVANRLQTKGFGATKPVDTNSTEDGKAQNRRVEFIRQ